MHESVLGKGRGGLDVVVLREYCTVLVKDEDDADVEVWVDEMVRSAVL